MNRASLWLLAALALALLLVACEEGGGEATATPPDTTGGASPAATRDASPAVTDGSPGPSPTPDETVASTAATPTDELPVMEFVRSDGTTVELPVEVPPRDEYTIGLSGRYALEGRGMLFYYPNAEGNAGFWMKNTHIDLDIAFVDPGGRIISIFTMTAESLDVVRPDESYEMAIEAPAGWYEANGVQEGDRAQPSFDIEEEMQR